MRDLKMFQGQDAWTESSNVLLTSASPAPPGAEGGGGRRRKQGQRPLKDGQGGTGTRLLLSWP